MIKSVIIALLSIVAVGGLARFVVSTPVFERYMEKKAPTPPGTRYIVSPGERVYDDNDPQATIMRCDGISHKDVSRYIPDVPQYEFCEGTLVPTGKRWDGRVVATTTSE